MTESDYRTSRGRSPSIPFAALAALAAVLLPAFAQADRCAPLAKPKRFDEASAMLAIFCEYDAAHGGTLLPVKYTKGWQAAQAKVLAKPLLVATYREGGVRKGVLAVQRQALMEGEPESSHASGAQVSVYVFREQEGAFVFEKGTKEAFTGGAMGEAPGGKLMRLGPDRYGLWFEGGDMHQGYTNQGATVVSLSDPRILVLGSYDTGQSNEGACSHEADDGLEACWGYEGSVELVPLENEPFALLRIRFKGTEKVEDQIVPKDRAECYVRRGDEYQPLKEPGCEERKGRADLQPFGAEEPAAASAPVTKKQPK